MQCNLQPVVTGFSTGNWYAWSEVKGGWRSEDPSVGSRGSRRGHVNGKNVVMWKWPWLLTPALPGRQKEWRTISQRKHWEEAEIMGRQADDEVILRKVQLITGYNAGEDRNAGGSRQGPSWKTDQKLWIDKLTKGRGKERGQGEGEEEKEGEMEEEEGRRGRGRERMCACTQASLSICKSANTSTNACKKLNIPGRRNG